MSDIKHFLSPRLTGKRFDEHSVPVEILQDFAALQELMTEIAKDFYLQQNPARKRVPKGFAEGVTLNLEKVEEGSAILKFLLAANLMASSILGENSNQYSYFEKAKEKVIEVINAAENGKDVKGLLSDKQLTYFHRIGRSLKDDETIFINPESTSQVAKLSKTTRHKILLSASDNATYTDTFDITALITSIDKSDKTFSLLINNSKISAKLNSQNFKTVVETFKALYSDVYVNVVGEGVFDARDKIIKIDSIDKMEILNPLDVSLRLNELSLLQDGWYNSSGRAPLKQALITFENTYSRYYPHDLPLPAIFPTLEGNIQLEWTTETFEISLEVDLDTFSAELFSVNTINQQSIEESLDLNSETDWTKLKQYLL
ncbi:hypothetical protein ACTJKN_25765 [Pedobacter sp. 22163]|uniref:hypothetical protein n=1 Tax=Pedobacter sp. 22163 TaxID=3453883 RepID=UPI003F85C287